ncbi:P-loop containing nucleoside triphosphate hydrolase protein [Sodiomyces alkalinus F11]|uniref:P-loop containing nucleoside triphosphate hydrolase protein n=1 Tax=Sodiomyces alkalinus (strain CBS 110278 / VKM F-3762 / F11) TaxID=1314773 RepID=A0A3N2PUB0_SODAK|nr:P-loop containing nucleoside triphosphate hydrolase protein [Sodiomyces alkalinus F11]ROT38071.1 P-loop containing nucleoside triphosphate hydrolase protein [Sodiomyces alkalinus F11]
MPQDGLADSKKLHPFFSAAQNGSSDSKPAQEVDPISHGRQQGEVDNNHVSQPGNGGEREGPRRKRQKTDLDPSTAHGTDTPGSKKRQNTKRKAASSLGPSILDHLVKPIGPESDSIPPATQGPPDSEVTVTPPAKPPVSPLAVVGPPQSQTSNIEGVASSAQPNESQPKKILKLNPKTGTFGSPPKSRPPAIHTPRPKRKPTSKNKQATFIVTYRFGHDRESRERIAEQINNILASTPNPTLPKKRSRAKKVADEKDKDAKGKQQPIPEGDEAKTVAPTEGVASNSRKKAKPPRQIIFSSTPCSPKKSRPVLKRPNFPHFGMKLMGLKVPGATHPAWPWKGAVHITGHPETPRASTVTPRFSDGSLKKSKGRATNIAQEESIMSHLRHALDVRRILNSINTTSDGFDPPPPELRLPRKHFESGPKLQKRVRPELRTPLLQDDQEVDSDSDDDIVTATATATAPKPHAAVARLYKSLATHLSAFDKSECEDLLWAHKYAPETADEVLQSGREAHLLRNWLEALKVQSVDTGNSPADQKPGKAKRVSASKKKRKRAKLDGFVVSSDEESNDLDEITDPEDSVGPKQTVVQNGGIIPKNSKESIRLSNVALVSGPHGSGKTATVYAVAKELGFEIFEINASSRRSGKDVLEKVGDMTRNHLVQRHRHRHREDGKSGDGTETDAGTGTEDETAKEVKSGKQGSVMSFFKPKATAKTAPSAVGSEPVRTPLPPSPPPKQRETDASKPTQPKAQKQSLILLEEADVLYEEDKQFWTTIMTLIVQSKRPFILTCNDESLIPVQSLNLYGIFRFSPPPEHLAVDLLLLIAANEGHALHRSPVKALLQSRSGDFRASLMELNYWCQLGIGDRRGGIDWFYPRWPRGCDRDENGHVVRVISEDTYLEGMGWLGRDSTTRPLSSPGTEVELMSQCWSGFYIDLGDWHNTTDMAAWVGGLEKETGSAYGRIAALDLYDEFSDALSTADLYSNGRFGVGWEESLDPTQPAIPAKTRDDYVVGCKLLETPVLADYDHTSTSTALCLKSQARRLVPSVHESRGWPVPVSMQPLEEPIAVSKIRARLASATENDSVTRRDMSLAFGPIAASDRQALLPSSYLDPSVFDRTLELISLDVAPYVRGILAHERCLAEERRRQSGLLSEGGRPGKKTRRTRVALSAGEGLSALRRESHFRARLNPHHVMRTGGEGWQEAVAEEMRGGGDDVGESGVSTGASSETGMTWDI